MAGKNLRILIVNDTLNRLNVPLRDAAVKDVEKGLKSITDTSSNDVVKAGFTVEWKETALSNSDYSSLTSLDFVVYLRASSGADDALKLAKLHIPIDKANETKVHTELAKQFKAEGGAAVTHGDKGVAFVVTDQFESMMFRGPFSADEIATQNAHIGREMAKLILHELGHLFGHVKHDLGIMESQVTITTISDDYKPLDFSANSKKLIRTWLENRVKSAK